MFSTQYRRFEDAYRASGTSISSKLKKAVVSGAVIVIAMTAAHAISAAPYGMTTYWQIVRSGTRKPQLPESKWCSPAPIVDMLAQQSRAEQVPGFRSCQRTESRQSDGTARIRMSCQSKLTQHTTSTTVTTLVGTPHDVRMHIDLSTAGPVTSDRAEVIDIHFAYLGECPANVRPGKFLTPAGELRDR